MMINPSHPFNIIAKPVGPSCNLDCTYCFYLEKEKIYPEVKDFRMDSDVLETLIRQKIEGHNVDPVHFTWQGGEPTLLGLEYFQEIVRLQEMYAGSKRIENGFQTNGILLNEAWCRFFKENNFLVGLSIDGPKELHDTYRIDRGGEGSFDQVMRALELLKAHEVTYNTLTVVNALNQSYADEVYDFLKSSGSVYWQFIPIVERKNQNGESVAPGEGAHIEMSEWSVNGDLYGRFLEKIFQRWVREDVGNIFIQQFESALANQMNMPAGVCIWNATCGRALAIEHNGDLYPCDHHVFPQHLLGNIMETPLMGMIQAPIQIQFGKDKLEKLPKDCRECNVLDLCHGECPKNRFMTCSNGDPGLNYLCNGYKYFFTSIRSELGVLEELFRLRQPSENIMQWMKEKDAGFPSLNPQGKDPCPCGSGTSYDICCAG